jgi:hypothetical protein
MRRHYGNWSAEEEIELIVDALLEHLEDAIEDGEISPAAHLGFFVRNVGVPLEDDTSFLPHYAASLEVDDEEQTLALVALSAETGKPITEPGLSVANLLDFVVAYSIDLSDYEVVTDRFEHDPEGEVFLANTVGTFIDDELSLFGALEWFEGCDKELG